MTSRTERVADGGSIIATRRVGPAMIASSVGDAMRSVGSGCCARRMPIDAKTASVVQSRDRTWIAIASRPLVAVGPRWQEWTASRERGNVVRNLILVESTSRTGELGPVVVIRETCRVENVLHGEGEHGRGQRCRQLRFGERLGHAQRHFRTA